MGNGGKFVEREQARRLRAQSWTLQEIADELGVAKGSVSVWVRDVDFVPKPRNRGHSSHQPHPLHVKKLAEIERCKAEAEAVVGPLTDRDLRMFVLGLYSGRGARPGDLCRWQTRIRRSSMVSSPGYVVSSASTSPVSV